MKRRVRNTLSLNRKKSLKTIDFSLSQPNKKRNREYEDTLIDSSDEESEEGSDEESDFSSSNSADDDEKETVGAKKIRLAREYLTKMEQAEVSESSSDSILSSSDFDDIKSVDSAEELTEHDKLGKRLTHQRLKQHGNLEQMIAEKVSKKVAVRWEDCSKFLCGTHNYDVIREANVWVQRDHIKLCRGHDLTCTCVALNSSGRIGYSASKDNSILMWDVERQIKNNTIASRWSARTSKYTRNNGEVLAMAASDDGRYLAVGGRDSTVKIYDVRQHNSKNCSKAKMESTEIRGLINVFEGHKGPITALEFRSKSSQLFSGSDDRCIRHYNLEELAYVETLYGHQSGVTGIACYGIHTEMPFSVGRDRTARAWKLAEDTHFIFRGGSKVTSADCISAINDHWFLTGHEDGLLALWVKDKKKPVISHTHSHGLNGNIPRSVTSIKALGGTDLVITGSSDGYIRLWKASTGAISSEQRLELLQNIPICGYVNDIAIGPKGRFCVAGVGQEPRLGRWNRVPNAKNRFAIIQLQGSIT